MRGREVLELVNWKRSVRTQYQQLLINTVSCGVGFLLRGINDLEKACSSAGDP